MADAGSIVVKIKGDASGLANAIKSSKKNVASLGTFTQKHSKAFLMAGGAVMGALGASAKAAMDFQEQMANVSTMLGQASMKYMPEFSKGIQDMAAQFGEGTDTLADGLYNILSASVPPAKAMDVLKVSVESARAGLTDTGVAADAITTILNSYGMSADEAGKVSDKLFAIVKRGKTTFGQLAPSIGRVAATAATAGVSLDDLGAMIATLTRAGISTDEAMTSVNGIITAFLKPTDDAKKAAEKFGLTLDSNTLKTLGFKGVLEKLNGATAEQLATIFPNVRALKGMAAALQSTTGFAEDYKTMLNATGSTQEAFGKQSDTAAFKMKQLKEQFIVASQGLGATLLPTLTELMQKLSMLIGKFNALPEPTKKLITKFTLFAGAGLLAAGAIGKIHTGIMEFMPVLSGLFTFIKGTAIPGLVSFQTAIGPIGWAIEAIIAVIALLVVAWKKDWGGIREKTEAVWKKIKPIFDGIKKVIDIIIDAVKLYVQGWIWMWSQVQPLFHNLGKAFEWIGNVVSDVFGTIRKWFDTFIGWILNAIDKIEKLIAKLNIFKKQSKEQGEAQENAVNGEGGIFDVSGVSSIPGHAAGGYFTRPHLAWIAEREPEYAIPESRLDDFLNTMRPQQQNPPSVHLNINIGSWLGDEQGIQTLVSQITEYVDRALANRRLEANYYMGGTRWQ